MGSSILEKVAGKLNRLEKSILYLLSLNNSEPVKGEVKLQKEVFLFSRYIDDISDSADFTPHNYGAYSESVETSLRELKSYELVEEKNNVIFLTDFGKRSIDLIESSMKNDEKEVIHECKDLLNKMTLEEVLVFSYFSFPDFTNDSVIIEKVKKDRIVAAISIYRKGLVNLEKAIFLSGLSSKDFMKRVGSSD